MKIRIYNYLFITALLTTSGITLSAAIKEPKSILKNDSSAKKDPNALHNAVLRLDVPGVRNALINSYNPLQPDTRDEKNATPWETANKILLTLEADICTVPASNNIEIRIHKCNMIINLLRRAILGQSIETNTDDEPA